MAREDKCQSALRIGRSEGTVVHVEHAPVWPLMHVSRWTLCAYVHASWRGATINEIHESVIGLFAT